MTFTSSPSDPSAVPVNMLRRLRDATETRRRLAKQGPEELGPVLPPMRRLFDRLLAAESLETLAPSPADDMDCLFSYRVRPDDSAPFLQFHVAAAEPGLLCFLGASEPCFEILQARQAGFQFHWRSDLVRAHDEQAAILGAFCAFAPHGELMIEHLAVPVTRRHRVREIRGWIALGRDLSEDLCGPDSLRMTRRPLRSRHVRLPRRLLRRPDERSAFTDAVASVQKRWGRSG